KEVSVLSSSESEIGSEFFEALKHLQQIHRDCESLLITENQRAGSRDARSASDFKTCAESIEATPSSVSVYIILYNRCFFKYSSSNLKYLDR
ncbi:5819_t:CDS:2, partial [Acaulospora colombiana]